MRRPRSCHVRSAPAIGPCSTAGGSRDATPSRTWSCARIVSCSTAPRTRDPSRCGATSCSAIASCSTARRLRSSRWRLARSARSRSRSAGSLARRSRCACGCARLHARCFSERPRKQPGWRDTHASCAALRRAAAHGSAPHETCRSPTRGSGVNHRRQNRHGLLRPRAAIVMPPRRASRQEKETPNARQKETQKETDFADSP